ncbi:hypothetical protein HQ560_20535, partial [bacterium]|nr:hypothetical protein [bacterium]
MRRTILLSVVCALAASAAAAGEIGFLEDFSLAKDRSVPLKQLIPGTEDHYYYNALHLQNQGKLDDVDKLLKPWLARYKRTNRVREIEHRQALLRYGKDPKGSLEYIRRQLGLQFNHQRELLDKKTTLPTRLDPKLISRATRTAWALSHHSRTMNGFEDRALEWASALKID